MRRTIPLLILLCGPLFAQKYPSALATDADLTVQKDRSQSTLLAPLTSSATSFTVVTGSKFTAGQIVTMDNEQMLVCSVVSNTVSVGYASCPNLDGRGYAGTSAASHVNGSLVSGNVVSLSHNTMAAEVKAIEAALGVNLANTAQPNPLPVNKGGTGAQTQGAALAAMLGSSQIGIANGGTGASTQGAALTAILGGAPLPIGNGGTGAATQGAALSAILGSSQVPIANGGTGAANQAAALAAILGGVPLAIANGGTGAAAQAAALAALLGSSQVGVANGGTGTAAVTGILIGAGTNPFAGVTGASGQYLRVRPGSTATYEFAMPTGLSVNAADYDFTPQTPGGSLIVGNTSITLTPVPFGVNGTDTQHYLYASAGVGTAEGCLITGGTGTSGQTTGNIIINCAHTHSGAWTLRSASAGIKEAANTISNYGTILLPGSGITIYAPLVLPTAISLTGQGFSKTGTSGGSGAIVTCATTADPCLIVADGLGSATGQGMGVHSGYKLYGPASGRGLWLGGDPANVFAPTAWCASYTRYRDMSIENFADGITVNSEANFVEFTDVVVGALTRALYVPSTAVSAQPFSFRGGLLSVPAGSAIVQDYNGYMTTQLVFIGGQISGTISGAQVAVYAQDVHFEPNDQGSPLVFIVNAGQNDVRIVGGLLSVHGGGAYGGPAPAYVFGMGGAGSYHNLTVKDATLQVDVGSTVPKVVEYSPAIGGRLVIENVNRLQAGVFTRLRSYGPNNPATTGQVVNQPEWSGPQTVSAGATTTFPESNFPDAGLTILSGGTVGGSGITAVAGLQFYQRGLIQASSTQTFTAGATVGNTITLTAGLPYPYYFDGTKIWIK